MFGESRIVRLDKVLYLFTVILNYVQGKKQLNSKPKFAEDVISDNEAYVLPQFDDFKNVADFFEFAAKLMRR